MIKLTNPAHKAEYKRLLRSYGKAVATRYAIVVSRPPAKRQRRRVDFIQSQQEIMKNLLAFLMSLAIAYTQDPKSCSDPRTQYPSNPPCQK